MAISITNALAVKGEGTLSGVKTILGAAMIILAHQVQALSEIIPMFPDIAWLAALSAFLVKASTMLSTVMTWLGNGFLTVGVWDKILKLFNLK